MTHPRQKCWLVQSTPYRHGCSGNPPLWVWRPGDLGERGTWHRALINRSGGGAHVRVASPAFGPRMRCVVAANAAWKRVEVFEAAENVLRWGSECGLVRLEMSKSRPNDEFAKEPSLQIRGIPPFFKLRDSTLSPFGRDLDTDAL